MKRIAGWVCVIGSVLAVIAFLILWGTHQISQPSTYVRAVFIPPVVFVYGLRLLRNQAKENSKDAAAIR
jgi:NhaP-type Na+/H+ or K+/H+ antiporter